MTSEKEDQSTLVCVDVLNSFAQRRIKRPLYKIELSGTEYDENPPAAPCKILVQNRSIRGWKMSQDVQNGSVSTMRDEAAGKLDERLERWKRSLPNEVSVGGLISRNKVHKWKAPFRTLVTREALLWRMHDLGQQIVCLRDHGFILGQRVLLRSALETLAILIYAIRKMKLVVEGSLSYFVFDEITKQLLMGSKNNATQVAAINILTALGHADKQHAGLVSMYEHLSESAHPNYDGVLCGYSTLNADQFTTSFSNQFEHIFGAEQEAACSFVFAVFEYEYNTAWIQAFDSLEIWLEQNDSILENEKGTK